MSGILLPFHKKPRGAQTPGARHRRSSLPCGTDRTRLGPLIRQLAAEAGVDMKNKAYRASPVGEAVGRYLNEMQYAGLRPNSIESYEQPLAWLAVAHDDLSGVDAFCKAGGTEMLMEFLHGNWGSAAETTRAHRWTVLNVFFGWCLDKNMIPFNPMRGIRRPRKRPAAERNAYGPDVIHQLTVAQGTLRDQCAIQLLGRMALRKDELRLLRIGDIDLVRNLVTVHGKGGKVAVLPIGFESLRADLYLYIQGEQRHHDEYL